MFVLNTLFAILYRRHHSSQLPEPSSIIFDLILGLILWPIGGYVWGLWMWKLAESRFIKQQASVDR
jgi:hypothetical protein